MSMTLVLVILSVILSMMAFNNIKLRDTLMLYPAIMKTPKEAYRLITSGFIHVNTMSMILNLITLFFFGQFLEQIMGSQMFALLYLGGIVFSNLPIYYTQMHNPHFISYGSLGGVIAVTFAGMYLIPWENINLFFILPIPAILLAVVFFGYSIVMAKKAGRKFYLEPNFWGAIYGILFMIITDPSHGGSFINKLMNPSFLN